MYSSPDCDSSCSNKSSTNNYYSLLYLQKINAPGEEREKRKNKRMVGREGKKERKMDVHGGEWRKKGRKEGRKELKKRRLKMGMGQ